LCKSIYLIIKKNPMLKKCFSISILCTLFYQFILAQPVSQTFSTAGTFSGASGYVVPAGYTAIVTIEAWGAGGSGGGGNAGNGDRTGGGGGAYAQITGQTLVAGNYTVTVGAGGVAPGGVNAGQNGGNSSFTTLVIAAGGTGGSNTNPGGAGGTAAASTGTTKFSGGTGGNRQNGGGAVGGGGGGGGSATATANGGNGANGAAGAGGAGGTGTGTGGAGGGSAAVGNNGIAQGGGGGGKGNTGAFSGNGAAGRVVVTVTTVLAIQFNYFNAAKGNGANTLNWLASCSSSRAIFEIERSADGRNFTAINTITATQERCAQPFTFVDNANLTGPVYYRIKSIDIDGGAKYSATIKLGDLPKNRKLVAVLPNPVSDRAQLNIAASKKDRVELSVFSIEGKMVQRSVVDLQAGTSIINLDVVNLQKGVYTVRGVFSDGQSSSIKFAKQ
jgi:Secretion system C-terminal sorting domain